LHRYLCLPAIIAAVALAGCGGLPASSTKPAGTATVVVTIGPATTNDPLDVEAVLICGGVRATYRPADTWVTVKNVPFGTESPPRQPLTVTAPGYCTYGEWIVLNVTAATYVDVPLTAVDLAETGTVQGRITDAGTGQGLVNALVQFTPQTATQQGDETTVQGYTDSDGKYIVGGIPIGPNAVKVGVAGYLEGTVSVVVAPDQGGQNAAVDLTLVSGDARIQVRGVVLDVATQLPISGAQVTVGDASATTSATGTFVVEDVPVGQREIVVTAEGHDEYRQTLNVLPGMGTLRVQLVESAPEPPGPPHNVTGVIEVRNRPDSRGAVVSAYNLRLGQVMGEDTTGPDGRYYLLVPAGEYEIRVSYEGQQLVRELTVPGGGRVVTGVDFVISAPPL